MIEKYENEAAWNSAEKTENTLGLIQNTGEIKTKGFKYKSICDFYYNVLKSYNNAINGFKELREEIIKEKKDFKIFCESKKK